MLPAAIVMLAACGDNLAPPPAQCWPDAPPKLAFTELELAGEIGVTGLLFVPGTADELLILEKSGRISHYRLATGALELLGELVLPEVRNTGDCGLLSAAFDPVTDQGRYLYAAHCLPGRGGRANRIVRLEFQPPDYAASVATVTEILEIYDPETRDGASSHNIGRLQFDDDGVLWVPTGERGVEERARDLASNLGKILRIVPSREPALGGYTPAPGNPYVDDPERSPAVYASGLRHPWTASLDRLGRLWVGDVGSDEVEEIGVISAPGQDLGWPDHEGPCSSGCSDVVDPERHWTRSSGHAYVQADPDAVPTTSRVAWVGPEYRPATADPYGGALDGALLFGDSCLGFLRAARIADDGTSCDEPVGHLANVVDMRQGPDGHLYAVTFGTCNTGDPIPPGRMYRVELAP